MYIIDKNIKKTYINKIFKKIFLYNDMNTYN